MRGSVRWGRITTAKSTRGGVFKEEVSGKSAPNRPKQRPNAEICPARGEQRPIFIQRKPHHVLFGGLRVRLWRVSAKDA